MKSKNFTWVNKKQCEPNKEIPLKYGDEIRLADEQFEFLLA